MDSINITVLNYKCMHYGIEAVLRARKQLGDSYYVFTINCEHFMTWAQTGKGQSKQTVTRFWAGTLSCTGGSVIGATLGLMFL